VRNGGRISGFLFASAAELDREFDRTGTAYPATESFAAVCVPPLGDGLLGLLAHEANHVVIENALGRPGTSFMAEGLASAVLSKRYHRAGRPFLYSWTYANRGRLPAVSALVNDGQWPTSDSQAVQHQRIVPGVPARCLRPRGAAAAVLRAHERVRAPVPRDLWATSRRGGG
jgi:hypothetical protein